MEPKISSNGITLIFMLLMGCNSGFSGGEENSDPVLVEYPVAYIERDVYTSSGDDEPEMASFSRTNPTVFNPGAALYIKESAAVNAATVNITADLFAQLNIDNNDTSDVEITEPRIDIRDLSVSADGQQFLVSIRAPEIEDADDDEQPTWNIWHYSHPSKTLERLIVEDNLAEQGDDLMPSFLPDGRIIFASNRQKLSKAILLDEGKSQYQGQNERLDTGTLNLHLMQADGSGIKQLTYNLSHDFYPLVMQNGKVLYSRWDAMGGINKISLYQMNPDGTENNLVYGWHSQEATIEDETIDMSLIKPQQLPSGEIFFMLSAEDGDVYQKRPIQVNINDYIDASQAIDTDAPEGSSALSPLFTSENLDFNFSSQLNESGRLNHLYALPDNSERYLLSLDLCRAVINAGEADERIVACSQLSQAEREDENITLAEPAYELWLFNKKDNIQQLVARPSSDNTMITEAAILQPSEINAEFIADKVVGNELDTELYNQQAAALHIRSVYDFDGVDTTENGLAQLQDPTLTAASDRPARFIRILRGVPMPSREVRRVLGTDFGRSSAQLMREIIGYSPIQPDGSVKIKVPANVPLALSILDGNGQRIGGRHRQWITLKAGETLECNGCHTSNSTAAHGRIGAEPDSINSGALSSGVPYTNTSNSILPDIGQTMAEAAEQTYGLAQLSTNLDYQDIWSNTDLSAINPSINLGYSNLETLAPNGSSCFDNWLAYCRIQINYEEHIAPLWQLERHVYDENTNELMQDNTCTSCHQPYDENSLAQVPAGQLDLSATASDQQTRHLTSYRELFFNDDRQAIVEGILVNELIEVTDNQGNVVYVTVTDNDVDSPTFGEQILALDEDDMPIAELTTVTVRSTMSTAGAQSSSGFFDVINDADHTGMLSDSELKLISEWLDIGAQYYNTPFYQQP